VSSGPNNSSSRNFHQFFAIGEFRDLRQRGQGRCSQISRRLRILDQARERGKPGAVDSNSRRLPGIRCPRSACPFACGDQDGVAFPDLLSRDSRRGGDLDREEFERIFMIGTCHRVGAHQRTGPRPPALIIANCPFWNRSGVAGAVKLKSVSVQCRTERILSMKRAHVFCLSDMLCDRERVQGQERRKTPAMMRICAFTYPNIRDSQPARMRHDRSKSRGCSIRNRSLRTFSMKVVARN